LWIRHLVDRGFIFYFIPPSLCLSCSRVPFWLVLYFRGFLYLFTFLRGRRAGAFRETSATSRPRPSPNERRIRSPPRTKTRVSCRAANTATDPLPSRPSILPRTVDQSAAACLSSARNPGHSKATRKRKSTRTHTLKTVRMSSSPRPGEVMALGNLIHEKARVVIDHYPSISGPPPDFHLPQLPLIKPDPGMERADSPHGSDTSRMSGPRPGLDAFASMSRYGSPPAMHVPISYDRGSPVPMVLPALTPDLGQMSHAVMPPMGQQQPVHNKSYTCSTCPKSFARRSDLARHGEFLSLGVLRVVIIIIIIIIIVVIVVAAVVLLTATRAHPQWRPTAHLRPPRLRQEIHSAVCSDCPPTRAHGREAAHLRQLFQEIQ
jgi:hypothetical protein